MNVMQPKTYQVQQLVKLSLMRLVTHDALLQYVNNTSLQNINTNQNHVEAMELQHSDPTLYFTWPE